MLLIISNWNVKCNIVKVGDNMIAHKSDIVCMNLVPLNRGVNGLVWIRIEGKINPNWLILIGLILFGFRNFFDQIQTKPNRTNQIQVGSVRVLGLFI